MSLKYTNKMTLIQTIIPIQDKNISGLSFWCSFSTFEKNIIR